jgi:hypothetical protein
MCPSATGQYVQYRERQAEDGVVGPRVAYFRSQRRLPHFAGIEASQVLPFLYVIERAHVCQRLKG